MKATVKKINIPSNKRIIVTSDIHGHYHHLVNILGKVNFTKDDILFIIGDIIEKGPFSLKTLRYVMELCNDFTVYPLIGNVDAFRLLMFGDNRYGNSEKIFEYTKFMRKHWGVCFFLDMCSELNIEISSANDIVAAKEQIVVKFKKELDFLRSLPTIIETQNYIFVHGGLPSEEIDSFSETDPWVSFLCSRIGVIICSVNNFVSYVLSLQILTKHLYLPFLMDFHITDKQNIIPCVFSLCLYIYTFIFSSQNTVHVNCILKYLLISFF